MNKNSILLTILSLLLFQQFTYAQVDVVYNDLVWSDEFNDNGAVDATKWFHQTQLPLGTGWYNGEQQHYTNQTANSTVANGILSIRAIKENYTDQGVTKNYTSARLNSKFAFKYGRIDVRAKLPVDTGTWPAIWMLGKNIIEPGGYYSSNFGTLSWPACGEIDIMERGIFPGQNVDYVQSTIHTPSSYGGSVNHGGTIASNVSSTYHIYSMNWSPNQLTFLLDGVPYYTYNPSVKNASTWPFNDEQYLLLNIAMGGIAGGIPSSFTQAQMDIDYVRVYQNTAVDQIAPTQFTATVGTVTTNSVELLINAVDNSGTVYYDIGGASTQTTSSPSGIQKSVIISGLSNTTTYSFTVAARDASGNVAVNNPINLSATTLGVGNNTPCSGQSSDAQQGSFSVGYNYNFETIGTDVKFTFELLDTDKSGVIAYLWKQSPFTEYPMTNVVGKTFTKTITGQSIGSTITYAVKFAYAGGLSVTKYFNYEVGAACNSLATAEFTKINEGVYPNPVVDVLHFESQETFSNVVVHTIEGKQILEQQIRTKDGISMQDFPAGIYFVTLKNSKGEKTYKIIKK